MSAARTGYSLRIFFLLGIIALAALTACTGSSDPTRSSSESTRNGVLTANILVDGDSLESDPPGITIDELDQLVSFHLRVVQEGEEFHADDFATLSIRNKDDKPIAIQWVGSDPSLDNFEDFLDAPGSMFLLEYSRGNAWIRLGSGDYVMTPDEELKLRVRPVTSDDMRNLMRSAEAIEEPELSHEFQSKWRQAIEGLMGGSKQSAIRLEGR